MLVEAGEVVRADLSLRTEATGHLQAWRRVEVSAPAAGQIVRRRVDEGDWVEAGTTLLELDDRDARLELEEARTELLRARAEFAVEYGGEYALDEVAVPSPQADSAMREHQETERLFEKGLVSRQELRRSEQKQQALDLLRGEHRQDVQAATSGLAQAEQRVERAQLSLQRTRVRAPFFGRIADLLVEEGQRVAVGEACMTLLDDSRLKVEVEVLEEDLVRLATGASAEIRLPSLGDLRLGGTIHSINPAVDPETGTGRLAVAISNREGRLLPGLFAAVQIETRLLRDRLLVPRAAVLDREGREVAFRIVDGRARWSYLRTGARDGDWVEVLEGLKEADRVAVSGHLTLAHDAIVQTVDGDG
ncbi:MAG: efflux RND transporter periplasmic adaptor subunit [Acidobacteriota bacterium]